MSAATYASDEDRAVAALLQHAERHPHGEERTDPALTADLDDEDLIGLLIARDHGVSPEQLAAYKSLGRSRGLVLDEVLRAVFRGELAMVVELPALERRPRRGGGG